MEIDNSIALTSSVEYILRRVRNYIKTGWTQNAWARDINGKEISEDSSFASCFCLSGAINRTHFVDNAHYDYVMMAKGILTNEICKTHPELASSLAPIATWNDEPGRTKEEVLELIDRALESVQ